MTLSRRAFAALGLLLLARGEARALGRLPFGGTLRLSLPFGLDRVDPHDLHDPLAALLGPALFDPLFAADASGAAYPTLAAGPVEVRGSGLAVRLRPGLRDSAGRALSARDLEFSLRRAASRGGKFALLPFGTATRDARDTDIVVFPKGNARQLEAALTSPLLAVVPRTFDPTKPEGTGAFRARRGPGGLTLERNSHAARGASYLDAIVVDAAPDLSSALRRFEAGEVDLGWLGRGLHRARPGAEMFRSPPLGWLVLHSGARLGAWGAPGMSQKLISNLEPARTEELGFSVPKSSEPGARYAGPAAEIVTRGDSAHLLAIAEGVAQTFGSSVGVRAESATALERLRATGEYDFLLDVVRTLGPTREQRYLSLVGVANPVEARRGTTPPGLDGASLALRATQATRTALLGEFAVVAGRVGGFRGLEAWDLGATWKG